MKILARAAIWPVAVVLACASPALGQSKPIATSSNYVPQTAVAYGQPGQAATAVTPGTPLPVSCIAGCSATGAGVATASAPTRTEGQASSLSFDLSGALRVVGGGAGGGGGPVTVADGADLAMGAKIDSPWSGTGSGSSIAILKSIRNLLAGPLAVTGTFWQATQPVSAVSLPLPTGASTAANQAAMNAALATIDAKLGSLDARMTDVQAAANSSAAAAVNLAQIGGAALATGSGVVGADVPRITLANNGPGMGAVGAVPPAIAHLAGVVSAGQMVGMIQASASVPINISTATTTQLVAASGSTRVFITGWDVVAAGTGTIKLVSGTGANCGTGTTDLTGAYSLTAQSGLARGGGLGPVLVAASGHAVCAVTSAAVGMAGAITFTQF